MDATTTNDQVSSTHIPDDIAFSILCKLPLKSLKRFSCVQKSWSRLFQNHNFMNMFRTNFFKTKHDDEDDEKTCLLLKKYTQSAPRYHSLCTLSAERFEDQVKLHLPPSFQYHDDSTSLIRFNVLGSTSVNGTLCLYGGC
jgi:molecular chaperone HtpG